MNHCIFKGNVTKKPELTQSKNGLDICRFSLAVNRLKKNQDGGYEADFVNFTAFGATAKAIANNVQKGEPLLVQGIYQTDKFLDKETGNNVYTHGFIVSTFEFCIPLNLKKKNPYANDLEGKSNSDYLESSGESLPFEL